MHIIRKCPLILAHVTENSENGADITNEGQQLHKDNEKKDSCKEGSSEKTEIVRIRDMNHNETKVA